MATLSLVLGFAALFSFLTLSKSVVRATILTALAAAVVFSSSYTIVTLQHFSVDIYVKAELTKHATAQRVNRSFESKIRQGSLLNWSRVEKKLDMLNEAPYARAKVFYLSLNCMLEQAYVKNNLDSFALAVCSKAYPYAVDFWTVPRIGTFTKRTANKKFVHLHEVVAAEWASLLKGLEPELEEGYLQVPSTVSLSKYTESRKEGYGQAYSYLFSLLVSVHVDRDEDKGINSCLFMVLNHKPRSIWGNMELLVPADMPVEKLVEITELCRQGGAL